MRSVSSTDVLDQGNDARGKSVRLVDLAKDVNPPPLSCTVSSAFSGWTEDHGVRAAGQAGFSHDHRMSDNSLHHEDPRRGMQGDEDK